MIAPRPPSPVPRPAPPAPLEGFHFLAHKSRHYSHLCIIRAYARAIEIPVEKRYAELDPEEELRKAFRLFDVDGMGKVCMLPSRGRPQWHRDDFEELSSQDTVVR